MTERIVETRAGRLIVPRSRGAMSGILLILLGAWGALVPFIGPYFDFAYTPDESWTWTAARGWLEVLPGAVVVVGGLLLLVSANRIGTSIGAWLAIAGGAWFIIGPQLADFANIGSVGTPTASSVGMRSLEALAYFYALGAVIILFAAISLGRISVRSIRDHEYAERYAERRDWVVPDERGSEPAPAAPAPAGATAPAAPPAYPPAADTTTEAGRAPVGEPAAPTAQQPPVRSAAQPEQPDSPQHEQPRRLFGRRRHGDSPADRDAEYSPIPADRGAEYSPMPADRDR